MKDYLKYIGIWNTKFNHKFREEELIGGSSRKLYIDFSDYKYNEKINKARIDYFIIFKYNNSQHKETLFSDILFKNQNIESSGENVFSIELPFNIPYECYNTRVYTRLTLNTQNYKIINPKSKNQHHYNCNKTYYKIIETIKEMGFSHTKTKTIPVKNNIPYLQKFVFKSKCHNKINEFDLYCYPMRKHISIQADLYRKKEGLFNTKTIKEPYKAKISKQKNNKNDIKRKIGVMLRE